MTRSRVSTNVRTGRCLVKHLLRIYKTTEGLTNGGTVPSLYYSQRRKILSKRNEKFWKEFVSCSPSYTSTGSDRVLEVTKKVVRIMNCVKRMWHSS